MRCPFVKCRYNNDHDCQHENPELIRVFEVECECPKCGNVFQEPVELLDCKSFEEE